MITTQVSAYSAVYVLLSVTVVTNGLSIVSSRPLSAPLTNMVSFEGKLYVGGANNIYVLDEDFNIKQTASTCELSIPVCNENKNVNKILLVYEHGDGLIICGTGNNGTCELRSLSDVGVVLSRSSYVSGREEDYLKVSSDLSRPEQAVITQSRELTIAVTFGAGIEEVRASSYTSYRYAISTRVLPKFFLSGRSNGFKKLHLEILQRSMEDYLIYYKASFQYNWMTYFVTNQKNIVGGQNYVSKLVRICQNDTEYNSYTDIVIQCTYNGEDYNLIQDAVLLSPFKSPVNNSSSMIFIGTFTRGNNPENPSGDTVVCMAELRSLDGAIMAAKRDFLSCEILPNSERYLRSFRTVCLNESDIREADYWCGRLPFRLNIIGKKPYKMESNYKISNEDGIVTALHGTVYNTNYVVLILGTSAGNILQTNLLEVLSLEEYGRETVDGFYPIQKIYAEDDDTLYVMTNHTVIKYSNTNCSEYKTCAETKAIRNPVCGWCVYKQRATRISACSKSPNHWLTSHGNCVSLSVEPSVISVSSIHANLSVTLSVQNMPAKQYGDTYLCRFIRGSNLISITTAIPITTNTFSCKLPEVSVHTEAIIELLVKMRTEETIFLSSTPFLLYQCEFYRRCIDCISTSVANCHWCSKSATCQEPYTCLMQAISDLAVCPKLLDNRGRHFIPDRISTTVVFEAENLIIDPFVVYKCVIPATNVEEEADSDASSISCSLNIMKTEDEKKEDYRIVVRYGPKRGQLVDVNDAFLNFVTVYSCTELATDCSHCQALNRTRYSCDWCENSRCIHSSNSCSLTNCLAPNITKVIPRDGPVGGGTRLTIFGTDLGKSISSVHDITVAGVPCILSNNTEDYGISDSQDFETFPPSRLVCTTQANSEERTGMVDVSVANQISNISVTFSYKRLMVTSIYPENGPKAGGTRITLSGDNLGIGNRQVVVVLGNMICLQPDVYPKQPLDAEGVTVSYTIQCTVAGSYSHAIEYITHLAIKVDGSAITMIPILYSFVDDPIITAISPKKGFPSGGTKVDIEGKNLDNAHSAVLQFHFAEEIMMESCKIISSERTRCKVPVASPALKEEISRQLTKSETSTCVGCIEVTAVLRFDGVITSFPIAYFLDPLINSLSGDSNTVTLDTKNPRLNINGEYLNLVATSADISITVGIETCAIVNITSVSIVCVAPASRPSSGIPGIENPEVNVTIGNIHQTVGYVRYLEDDNTITIVISSVIAVFLIVLIAAGAILLYRKYRQMRTKLRHLERIKDEKEMTGVTGESRYTTAASTAGNRESTGVYADISEDDMIKSETGNERTEEDKVYDKPDGYLESRPYLKINETTVDGDKESDRDGLSEETMIQSSVAVSIHRYNDNPDKEYLHPITPENENTDNV